MSWLGTLTSRLAPRRPPRLHIAGDVGEGPVVVLLHGIASSAATFDKLVPLLTERYRCISIDLLGFGESPQPKDATYSIEEHVAAIKRTIRSLRLRAPFVLVGHSLGALLAARFAAENPRQVSRLVLVSAPIYLEPFELGDPRARSRLNAYRRAYEFLRTNKDFTTVAAMQIGRLLQIGSVFAITEKNWTPFALSLKNCIESQTALSDIARVRVPVDVLYGVFDQFVEASTMDIIEQLRQVTVYRVDANDHLVRTRLSRAIAALLNP